MKTFLLSIIVVIVGIVVIAGIVSLFIRSNPYTNEEWEEQMAKDFEKYGPLPDDIDSDIENNS